MVLVIPNGVLVLLTRCTVPITRASPGARWNPFPAPR